MLLPEQFTKNILSVHGEKGKAWLDNLPILLAKIEKHWDIIVETNFSNLSFNYVAPGFTSAGESIVVKCGLPSFELNAEIAALQHFNGQGAIRVIQFELDLGAMLLDRISPGNCLDENLNINNEKETEIAVALINKLHHPLSEKHFEFPTLHNWFDGFKKLREHFNGKTGPFPEKLIKCAEILSQELLSSMGPQVLLHGDLHYSNILFSEQIGWLTIDPKGVIGEREFEIALPSLIKIVDKKLLLNNLHQFIEFSNFDKERVFAWCFVKCVLAAWWFFEDSGETNHPFLGCAEILRAYV